MNPTSPFDLNENNQTNKLYSSIQTEPKIQLIKNKKFNLISSNHSQPVYFIKENKKKKKIISDARKKELLFNKLYGLDKEHFDQYRKIRREKNLPLPEYQNELIKLGTNLCKGNVMKLIKEFKTIRIETSLTIPLPPINYQEVLEEANQITKKDKEKKSVRYIQYHTEKISNKITDPELIAIKNYRKAKSNPSLMKMYEILPEHIVNIFAGRIR